MVAEQRPCSMTTIPISNLALRIAQPLFPVGNCMTKSGERSIHLSLLGGHSASSNIIILLANNYKKFQLLIEDGRVSFSLVDARKGINYNDKCQYCYQELVCS
jgi:hypothetical protein